MAKYYCRWSQRASAALSRTALPGGRSIKGWHGQRPGDAVTFSMLFNILPMIETFPLEKAAEAFEKMMSAKVHFSQF